MSVFRIIYLGTPDIAAEPLRALLKDEHFQIPLIVTQPDRPAGRKMELQMSPVKKVAVEFGIPVLTPENINLPEVLEEIRKIEADAAVVVAFGQILSLDFLNLFPLRAVNVHASLLPRWRGAAPIQRALMEGDEQTGVSLQIIVPKLDAGPVLGVRKIRLEDESNAESLYAQMIPLAIDLLKIDFVDYLRGNLSAQVQDDTRVTVARKIKKEDGRINWTLPARQIFNRFRGLYSWPGSWGISNGKVLKIWGMSLEDRKSAGSAKTPGTIVEVLADSFVVVCGEGQLRVTEVQPESRKRQAVREFLLGHPLKVGDTL